jgi:hypothetical protein
MNLRSSSGDGLEMHGIDGWDRFLVREEQRERGEAMAEADGREHFLGGDREHQRRLVEASLRARPPVLDARGHERR